MQYTTNPDILIKGKTNRKIYGDKVIANDVLSIMPIFSDVLNSFNGKKCFKANGSKTKAFNDAITSALNNGGNFNTRGKRVYFNTQYSSCYLSLSYWIAWETFPNDERKCTDGSNIEVDFYFGKKDAQTLTLKDGWEEEVIKRCNDMLSVNDLDVKYKLIDIAELIKKAEDINNSLPYYARVTLPYMK